MSSPVADLPRQRRARPGQPGPTLIAQRRAGLPQQHTPTIELPAHDVVISHDASFARAQCTTCGWLGPGRRAMSRVADDVREHREHRDLA